MELRVDGAAPARPFELARSRFEIDHDLELPVAVEIRRDPTERTRTVHEPTHHRLTVSEQVARSSLAPELAVHEFAHMRRREESHPSHMVDVSEAIYLASSGTDIDRTTVAHAYQIANHVRDIYADDITFEVASGEKLASFFESRLAEALADQSAGSRYTGYRLSAGFDPAITAVNAGFALGLLERHDVERNHRLYELAHAAQADAPRVDVSRFRREFRDLNGVPNDTSCLRTLVDLFEAYFEARAKRTERASRPRRGQ
ncbi:MAG: DUF5781 family protein [Halodesulfurarchaeum sp.]